MESNELLRKNESSEYHLGDIVSQGLKGIYKVDHFEQMNLGESQQACYVLEQLFVKALHKTFVPTNQSKKLRYLISKDELHFESFFNQKRIEPLDYSLNSNKKILYYEKHVNELGFWGLVETYLAVKGDRAQAKTEDKRYCLFYERVQALISDELSLALDTSAEEAWSFFEQQVSKYNNQ